MSLRVFLFDAEIGIDQILIVDKNDNFRSNQIFQWIESATKKKVNLIFRF